MRKAEQRLWDTMRRNAPEGLWMQRIENSVGEGAPDVFVASEGSRMCWVELKAPHRPTRPTTPLLGCEGLRVAQVNWALKARSFGVRVYVLIRDTTGELSMVGALSTDPRDINSLTTGELAQESLASTWEEVWEVLR